MAHRQLKLRTKEKIDCHNHEYLDFLRRKTSIVDWIQYNITFGISLLWNRVKESLSFGEAAAPFKEMELLIKRSAEVDSEIQQLSKPYSFHQGE